MVKVYKDEFVSAPDHPARAAQPAGRDAVSTITRRASAAILSVVDITVPAEHHETLRRTVLDAIELVERRFRDELRLAKGE